MSSCSRMLLIAVVASSMASITGCGGSSNAASTTQGPTQPTYSASAKYAYVATGIGFVDEYSISTSGTFTKIGSAPTTNGPTGTSIAIDPKYRFLYTISGADGGSTISMFTINASTGVLVPTSPASVNIAGTFSQGIAVDGLGKFVYTADTDSQTVSSLSINQTTGVLTPTSVPSVPGSYATNGVTADASGKYVYASNENGLISEFVINQPPEILPRTRRQR